MVVIYSSLSTASGHIIGLTPSCDYPTRLLPDIIIDTPICYFSNLLPWLLLDFHETHRHRTSTLPLRASYSTLQLQPLVITW